MLSPTKHNVLHCAMVVAVNGSSETAFSVIRQRSHDLSLTGEPTIQCLQKKTRFVLSCSW